MNKQFQRDYNRARSKYAQRATDAIQYARNLAALRDADCEIRAIDVENDGSGNLDTTFGIFKDDPDSWDPKQIATFSSCVEVDVSDHGNIHADDADPYIVMLAAEELARCEENAAT